MTSMRSQFRKLAPRRTSLIALATLIALSIAFGAQAKERVWTRSDGKKVKAEYVSATDKLVVIKIKGKEYKVPLAKLSQQDRDYVKSKIEEGSNKENETEIRRQVLRFYQALRKVDPQRNDALHPLLSKLAAEKLSSNASFFDGITGADQGQKPSVKKIEIDNATALANISVKIAGRFRAIQIGLEKDDSEWLLNSMIYETEDGERKKMDFAEAKEVDPDAEPEESGGGGNSRNGDGYAAGGKRGDRAATSPADTEQAARDRAAKERSERDARNNFDEDGSEDAYGGQGSQPGRGDSSSKDVPPFAAPPPDSPTDSEDGKSEKKESDDSEPEYDEFGHPISKKKKTASGGAPDF